MLVRRNVRLFFNLHAGILVARGHKKSSLLLLLACLAIRGAAQAPDLLPQRGVYPNGSYSFDKLEAINKQNGVLTYSIPITTLPVGRGGI